MKSAQEQLAEIELAKINKKEEAKKRSQKVIKFGCLPIIIIIGIAIIVSSLNSKITMDYNGYTFRPEVVVNQFCKLSLAELEKEYGPYDELAGGLFWILNKEEDLRVTVFFDKKGNQEVVRFSNISLGMFFWNDLGWDMGDMNDNPAGKYTTIEGLQGIKQAMHKENTNLLNIELTGNYTNFGKE